MGVADAACYAQAVNRQNVGARAEARPPHHPRVGRHSSQAFRAAAERPASHHRVIAMPLFSPSAHARSVCYRKRPRHSARVGTGVCCSLCVPRGSNKKHRGGAGSKPTRDHVGAWNRHTVHTKFTQTNLILTTKPTHRRTCTGTTGVTDSRRDTAVRGRAGANFQFNVVSTGRPVSRMQYRFTNRTLPQFPSKHRPLTTGRHRVIVVRARISSVVISREGRLPERHPAALATPATH